MGMGSDVAVLSFIMTTDTNTSCCKYIRNSKKVHYLYWKYVFQPNTRITLIFILWIFKEKHRLQTKPSLKNLLHCTAKGQSLLIHPHLVFKKNSHCGLNQCSSCQNQKYIHCKNELVVFT